MTNAIIKPEQATEILGVPARAFGVVADTETGRILNQTIKASRQYEEDGRQYRITANIRFDDSCRNGHESFAITGDIDEKTARGTWREYSGGCIHDEIARRFPELARLIPWHLTSTDGPMHYIANTSYLAGNRDYNGLLKGEKRQIKNGRTGLPCWKLTAINEAGEEIEPWNLPKEYDGETPPESKFTMEWRPWCRTGEGKERELDAARRAANWPEATDEELCVPRAKLEAALLKRAPALLAAFRADIEAAGLLWPVAATAGA